MYTCVILTSTSDSPLNLLPTRASPDDPQVRAYTAHSLHTRTKHTATMAKKKAKGKDPSQQKAADAKRAMKASEATFGMKNKNKSKKVQQHIQQVNRAAGVGKSDGQKAKEASERKAVKAAQNAAAKESLALFGFVETKKKKKKKKKKVESVFDEVEEKKQELEVRALRERRE